MSVGIWFFIQVVWMTLSFLGGMSCGYVMGYEKCPSSLREKFRPEEYRLKRVLLMIFAVIFLGYTVAVLSLKKEWAVLIMDGVSAALGFFFVETKITDRWSKVDL